MKSMNRKLGLLVIFSIAGLCFLGYRLWINQPSDRFLGPILKAPEFSFKDQTGKVFSSDQLKGKVWVADFIFTRCQGQCPMLEQWFRILQDKWKINPDFKLISITVDPNYDTVAVLKEYADNLDADPHLWHFLTGPKKEIYTVIQNGFHLSAAKDPQEPVGFEFVHTTRLVLVDGNGMIRGLYDGQETPDVNKLQKDIQYLLNSSTKS